MAPSNVAWDSGEHHCLASYASADRIDVMRSVQGINKSAPQVEIFVDVDSLHSGDDWEAKISAYISPSDVLYPFWSTAASPGPSGSPGNGISAFEGAPSLQ